MFTLQQLYALADELSMKWWNVPFDGVIELKNRRWKNINGRFLRSMHENTSFEIPAIIQMCTKRNGDRTEEEVKGTLLHELVHWRLFTLGVPHRDSDKEFVAEAIRVGAPISGAKKAQKAFEKYKAI